MGEVAAAVYDLTRKRAPSSQAFKDQFRNMLGTWLPSLLVPKATSTRPKELKKGEKQRKEKRQAATKELFSFLGEVIPLFPDKLEYCGWQLATSNAFKLSNFKLQYALWELSELNFCAELVILDRYQVPALWQKDAGKWHEKVLGCFSGSTVVPQQPFTFLSASLGLGASPKVAIPSIGLTEELKNRMHKLCCEIYFKRYLPALYKLMVAWPGAADESWYKNVVANTQEKEEELLFSFYSQHFFDTFGRAPTLPRDIPWELSWYVYGV